MSSFVPTQAELLLVNQILEVADTEKLNLVTGKAAVKVFEGAKLQPHVLGEIWSIADKENNGFLTRSGLATAVRLIGHAQRGEKVVADLLDRPATTLAHIQGVPQLTSRPISATSSPGSKASLTNEKRLPPLTQEDKAKFARLFISCGPVNGLLSGEKARETFVKSKLSIERLGSIWALADTQNRGALDLTDFTIAMYLIQASMSDEMPIIPNALPSGFYEQAGGRHTRALMAQNTGNSSSSAVDFPSPVGSSSRFVPVSLMSQVTGSLPVLQSQGTGQQFATLPQQNTGSILGASASAFEHVAPFAPQWDVTAEEKARFDQFFDGLDTQRQGSIEADVAVPFMLQSQLSQDILAPIWDLADLNNDGCLTRDGFAIAMHLIQSKLAGKEIPTTMPDSLVPPSLRKGKGLSIISPVSTEPVRDLLGDETPPTSPPTSAFTPLNNTSLLAATRLSILSNQHTSSLSPRLTALGTRSPQERNDTIVATHTAKRDLLGDDDDTTSITPPVSDNSAEIGNLRNQLQSTDRSLDSVKTDRQKTEQSIVMQANQLSSLQTQLASSKAAYETETRLLEHSKERFESQESELRKFREELIRAESDLSALRVERSEIEDSLMRDKEEHRDLQRKMKEVSEETECLKLAVERIQKDTKHQKGLLAIARKQLLSKETDQVKAAKELGASGNAANDITAELEQAEAQLSKDNIALPSPIPTIPVLDVLSLAASTPLPHSPSPSSSMISPMTSKSKNPFERLAMSTGSPAPVSTTSFGVSTETTGMHSSPSSISPAQKLTMDHPRTYTADPGDSSHIKSRITVTHGFSPFVNTEESSLATAESDGSVEDSFGSGQKGKEKMDNSSPSSNNESMNDSLPSHNAPESPVLASRALEIERYESDSDSGTERGIDLQIGRNDSFGSGLVLDAPGSQQVKQSNSSVPPSSELFDDAFGFKDVADWKSDTSKLGYDNVFEPNVPAGQKTDNSSSAGTNAELLGGFFSSINSEVPVEGSVSDKNKAVHDANAFDEALIGIAHTANSAQAQFKLDSSFEDSFDFAAAMTSEPLSGPLSSDPSVNLSSAVNSDAVNITSLPPTRKAIEGLAVQKLTMSVPSVSTIPDERLDSGASQLKKYSPIQAKDKFGSSGSEEPTSGQVVNLAFGNAFGSLSSRVSSTTTDNDISFNDVFRGEIAPALGDSLGFTKASAFDVKNTDTDATSKTFPLLSSTPSSPNSKRPTAAAGSSIRSVSPPPRTSSPKPRPSSSDGGVSVNKAPSTHRHSKLSIRLPFGRKDRKKTKHEPLPPSRVGSSLLSPVDEPLRNTTPAVEDDAEPVKQLCGMGFSRSQAVEALESNGYNFQKALDSLLRT